MLGDQTYFWGGMKQVDEELQNLTTQPTYQLAPPPPFPPPHFPLSVNETANCRRD